MLIEDIIDQLGPALLVMGVLLGLASLWPQSSAFARAAAAVFVAAMTFRYVGWRVGAIPDSQSPLRDIWAVVFLGIELLNLVSGLMVLFFMSRHKNRSADADAAQDSPLLFAPVDVFIATYNEPHSVLERTLIAALAIDHPDHRVWVLDDGARDWVRDMAEELGAYYVSRIKGKHAKAGNVNNGLQHALKTGRKPEFVLLLDADFVANRHILRRTLGLFQEADVGIVQNPQHFFNPDPIQIDLACRSVWPDEQRFFFNVLLPSKDAWGAAFCCGTSAIMRVAALQDSGGLATETVTEDMLTSFKMREHGWRTIFLNERLSLGLAPEGLSEYLTQRGRWCLGALQQLHTRWSFHGAAPIGFINRLSCLDGMLFWLVTFPFRVMVMSAPAIYWWTGTAVIQASVGDLVYWMLPSVLGSIMFMGIWGRSLILPIITDVTQLLATRVVVGNALAGVFRPKGRAFKVTPKGVSTTGVTVQWDVMMPFIIIGIATALGLFYNASSDSSLMAADGYGMNVFWSVFTIFVMGLACLACVEMPRRRVDERFECDEPAVVVWPGRSGTICRVKDISMGGARVVCDEWTHSAETGVLSLDGGKLSIPFTRLRLNGSELIVRFRSTPAIRHALIERLFDDNYVPEIEEVHALRVLGLLARRLIA